MTANIGKIFLVVLTAFVFSGCGDDTWGQKTVDYAVEFCKDRGGVSSIATPYNGDYTWSIAICRDGTVDMDANGDSNSNTNVRD